MKLSNREKNLLIFLGILFLVFIPYMFLTKPALEQTGALKDQYNELEQTQAEHEMFILQIENMQTAENNTKKDKKNDISKRFLDSDDPKDLHIFLNKLQEKSELEFASISFSASETPEADETSENENKTVYTTKTSVQLNMRGGLGKQLDFFRLLKKEGKIYTIDNVELTSTDSTNLIYDTSLDITLYSITKSP